MARSASASQLVPEKRVNKNGVLVTKHVRAAAAEPTARDRSIPAVAVTPRPTPAELSKDELVAAIIAELPPIGTHHTDQLPTLRVETLRAIHAAAALPEARAAISSVLQNELGRVLFVTEPFLELTAHAMPFAVTLSENSGDLDPYGAIRYGAGLGGFREYEGAVTEDEVRVFKAYVLASAVRITPSEYSTPHFHARDVQKIADRITEVEEALPALAAALHTRDTMHRWEHVEAALAAVQESGLKPQALADFMLERGTTDIAEAARCLHGITAPLQEGVL